MLELLRTKYLQPLLNSALLVPRAEAMVVVFFVLML